MTKLSNRIKELRKQSKLSQRELAHLINVSQQTVGSWETGRSEPNSEMINKLSDYFGVTTDFLLGHDIGAVDTPSWATASDVIDMEKMLKSADPMSFGNLNLSASNKEKAWRVLRSLYWDDLKELKEKGQK
ncbi:helix-turn-helix transcriptional regulator [Lactiplantibacillus paraxiangfangensis]|uniref:helix-turn-helix transcriptional regulator n=1 Tax=Lactiplantibacillus paraxiangfangensis TaxID=3076224 RepID=UPI0030C73C52